MITGRAYASTIGDQVVAVGACFVKFRPECVWVPLLIAAIFAVMLIICKYFNQMVATEEKKRKRQQIADFIKAGQDKGTMTDKIIRSTYPDHLHLLKNPGQADYGAVDARRLLQNNDHPINPRLNQNQIFGVRRLLRNNQRPRMRIRQN